MNNSKFKVQNSGEIVKNQKTPSPLMGEGGGEGENNDISTSYPPLPLVPSHQPSTQRHECFGQGRGNRIFYESIKLNNLNKLSLLWFPLLILFTLHSSPFTAIIHASEVEPHRFSLEFREIELGDVLRMLAEESGQNIIVPEGLTQKLSLSLDRITLDDALEVILKAHGFSYVTEKGIIRIIKLSEAEAQGEELLTEVVTMNYARATDLKGQVKGVLTKMGTVSVDKRTNSVIIKDTRRGIDDARELLKKLDPRTSQVLIKARIVEASSNFSRSLGIRWGGSYEWDGGANSVTGGAGNNYAVNLPAADATSGVGLSIGSLTNNNVLDVQISAAEQRGEVRIISTPKVTTVDNMPATVSSGIEYSIRTTAVTGGAEVTTGTTQVSARTSLTVTPQVSVDDHILLTIEASRDEPDFTRAGVDDIPAVLRKNASTTVLVKDGDTTVIGGLYKNTNSVTNRSVPFLSRIPVLGWLFKSKDRSEESEELLIFITPTIIRNEG